MIFYLANKLVYFISISAKINQYKDIYNYIKYNNELYLKFNNYVTNFSVTIFRCTCYLYMHNLNKNCHYIYFEVLSEFF